jgi:hypothetical protein
MACTEVMLAGMAGSTTLGEIAGWVMRTHPGRGEGSDRSTSSPVQKDSPLFKRSLALATAAAALAVPATAAQASTLVDQFHTTLSSGSETLATYQINGRVGNLADFDVDVAAKATWTGDLTNFVTWDPAKLRTGGTLPVGRNTALASGSLKVTWSLSGRIDPLDLGYVNFGVKTVSDEATCTPLSTSENFDCVATSAGLPLVRTPGIPNSPYVKVVLKARFTVTPEGVIVNRTFSLDGTSAGSLNGLTMGLGQLPAADNVTVGCDNTGADASYRLSGFKYSPAVTVTQQPTIQIGLMDGVVGLAELPSVYDKAFGPAVKSSPTFELTGNSHTTALGTVGANNVPPSINNIGDGVAFYGLVGKPVQLSATVHAVCGATYKWVFHDGTVSYGATPQRTWSKAGKYYGDLYVTDGTGLTHSRDFYVYVA